METERESRFRDVFLHLLAHPEFYESLDHFQARDDYVKIAKSLLPDDWRVIRQGVWFHCVAPEPLHRMQGWKIHVSATFHNAEPILKATIPILVKRGVHFKFALDPQMLSLLNSKTWHRGGSGKFMTIYPWDDRQFHALLEDIATKLNSFNGPYILSDKRYKNCRVLYYRYGGIASLSQMTETGHPLPVIMSPDGHQVPDIRTPFFNPPDWVNDPYPDEDEALDAEMTLKNGRYKVVSALSFSNSGGVYKGLDTQTGKDVVIKEARPFTQTDRYGNDSVLLLEKEHRILSKLVGRSLTAEPVDLFWEWEHLFLVETYIEGVSLAHYGSMRNCLLKINPTDDYCRKWFEEVKTIGINLATALQTLHDCGIIFGDLSPNNVILNLNDLTLRLIDLEGAYESGVDKVAVLFTPGFAPKGRASRTTITYADDYYALGSLLLSMIFPINALASSKSDAREVFLNSVQRDYSIPAELISTIKQLMDPDESNRLKPNEVVVALSDVNVDCVTGVRLGSETEGCEQEVRQTISGIIEYTLAIADTRRRDKLFPADVKAVNPLDVANGAVGVAYALHKMGAEIPKQIADWILHSEATAHHYPPGLFYGLSGIAWALDEIGYPDQAIEVYKRAENHHQLYGCDDLACGVAGFGLASLYFWRKTCDDGYLDTAIRIGNRLIATAKLDDRGCRWSRGEQVHLGLLRGSSGIALFLLYLYLATKESRFLDVGERAMDYELSYAQRMPEGYTTFPETTTSRIMLPYLERGTAGVASVTIRYLLVTDSEQHRLRLEDMLPDLNRKYTIFPGLFMGLAGIGNFHLDCYQFSGNELFRELAKTSWEGLLLFGIKKTTGVAFPGDFLYRISTDLASGSAGVGLFLNRLTKGGENPLFFLDHLLPPGKRIDIRPLSVITDVSTYDTVPSEETK